MVIIKKLVLIFLLLLISTHAVGAVNPLCIENLLSKKLLYDAPSRGEFMNILKRMAKDLASNPNPSAAVINERSALLLSKAEQFLTEAKVEFYYSPSGEAIIIAPKAKAKNPLNRVSEALVKFSPNKAPLAYHPKMLMTHMYGTYMRHIDHSYRYYYLTHMDLLRGPKSELIKHQVELTHDEISLKLNPGNIGNKYATPTYAKKFWSLYQKRIDRYEVTSIWSEEKQIQTAQEFIDGAKKYLDQQGIKYSTDKSPLELKIVADQNGSKLNRGLKQWQENVPSLKATEFIYAPKLNMKFNLSLDEMNNGLSQYIKSENRLLVSIDELLSDRIGINLKVQKNRLTPSDDLNSFAHKVEDYIRSFEPVPYVKSTTEPLVAKYRPGKDRFSYTYGNTYDVNGNCHAQILDNPYLDFVIAYKGLSAGQQDATFNAYLSGYVSSWRFEEIGTAIQFDNNQLLINLNLDLVAKQAEELPPLYAKAFDRYLNYLEGVYKDRLKIDKDKFDRLREISNSLKNRSEMFFSANNSIVDYTPTGNDSGELFSHRVNAANKVSYKGPEGHQTKISSTPLPLKFAYRGGMIVVRSHSPAEKLPLEILHDINLPRMKNPSGGYYISVEMGRASGSSTGPSLLEYLKMAAVKIKRQYNMEVKQIYIEVDATRRRLLSRYGFKDVKTKIKDSGYYKSKTDFVMVADIDQFIDSVLKLPPK